MSKDLELWTIREHLAETITQSELALLETLSFLKAPKDLTERIVTEFAYQNAPPFEIMVMVAVQEVFLEEGEEPEYGDIVYADFRFKVTKVTSVKEVIDEALKRAHSVKFGIEWRDEDSVVWLITDPPPPLGKAIDLDNAPLLYEDDEYFPSAETRVITFFGEENGKLKASARLERLLANGEKANPSLEPAKEYLAEILEF